MTLHFNHKPSGSTIGSGNYIFRHYGDEGYTITCNLTNCVGASGNPTHIGRNLGDTATLVFTANSGYIFPSRITVSGASYTWNKSTGTIILSDATDNVSIAIIAGIEIQLNAFTLDASLTSLTIN